MHNKEVLQMAKLGENKIISGGCDGLIKVWSTLEQNFGQCIA